MYITFGYATNAFTQLPIRIQAALSNKHNTLHIGKDREIVQFKKIIYETTAQKSTTFTLKYDKIKEIVNE